MTNTGDQAVDQEFCYLHGSNGCALIRQHGGPRDCTYDQQNTQPQTFAAHAWSLVYTLGEALHREHGWPGDWHLDPRLMTILGASMEKAGRELADRYAVTQLMQGAGREFVGAQLGITRQATQQRYPKTGRRY